MLDYLNRLPEQTILGHFTNFQTEEIPYNEKFSRPKIFANFTLVSEH